MRRSTSPARQRGLSFFGLIFLGLIIVGAFAVGGQSLPILIENQAIKKAALKAAREGNTVAEVRAVFDRAASIDDIASVKAADLEVTKVNDKVVVGYKYERDVHLFGPAYLVYRFEGKTN
ncbi:MAG: DUF4845 domain-containing protein [Acidovorax sp.]